MPRSAAAPRADSLPSQLDALDDVLFRLRKAVQRPGYRRRILEGLEEPLELSTLRLLGTVHRADDEPSIGEIADMLLVDPSTASRMVERAVGSGHLERRPCDDDRRRTQLRLTRAGARVLERATARRRQLLGEIARDWDTRELGQLVDLLGRLQEGFDRLEETS